MVGDGPLRPQVATGPACRPVSSRSPGWPASVRTCRKSCAGWTRSCCRHWPKASRTQFLRRWRPAAHRRHGRRRQRRVAGGRCHWPPGAGRSRRHDGAGHAGRLADIRRRARSRGLAARAAVQQRFSLDSMVAAYGELYKRLLTQGGGARRAAARMTRN